MKNTEYLKYFSLLYWRGVSASRELFCDGRRCCAFLFLGGDLTAVGVRSHQTVVMVGFRFGQGTLSVSTSIRCLSAFVPRFRASSRVSPTGRNCRQCLAVRR